MVLGRMPSRPPGRRARLLLAVLKQLSRVYLWAVQTRLFLYRKGIFRHHTLGCQVIELGPCNASIHKVDECVRAADLEVLSKIYEEILNRLLGSAGR